MAIVSVLAVMVLYLTAAYFVFLGLVALSKPALAQRFLLGFAESPRVHYLELMLRLIVALALLLHAPLMPYSQIFLGCAWVVLGTTLILLLLPWQWHRTFARRTVPIANRYVRWIGGVALVLGLMFLWCL